MLHVRGYLENGYLLNKADADSLQIGQCVTVAETLRVSEIEQNAARMLIIHKSKDIHIPFSIDHWKLWCRTGKAHGFGAPIAIYDSIFLDDGESSLT